MKNLFYGDHSGLRLLINQQFEQVFTFFWSRQFSGFHFFLANNDFLDLNIFMTIRRWRNTGMWAHTKNVLDAFHEQLVLLSIISVLKVRSWTIYNFIKFDIYNFTFFLTQTVVRVSVAHRPTIGSCGAKVWWQPLFYPKKMKSKSISRKTVLGLTSWPKRQFWDWIWRFWQIFKADCWFRKHTR